MKLRIALVTLVALTLGVLLVWRNDVITPSVYRLGFFLGFATLIVWLMLPGEMYISIGHGSWKHAVILPIVMTVLMTPSIVLVEAGIAGYRGFASFMRYASLLVAMLGLFWLVGGFIVPLVLRRRLPKSS
jgi:hypothetical protein